MDDNSQFLDMFFEETDEHLLKLNELVLEFEKDASDTQILNDIFRSAHTLKGMAGTMGFEKMTEITHKLENVFTILKEGKIIANQEVISVVFNSLDALAEIVEHIRQGTEDTADYSEITNV
ncbi:Hpt domain-containing protein, partial [Jeotgalibaca porci]